MANDSNNNALVIAIFNFIYLALSIILLAPKTYLSNDGSFLPAYGAASTVYSLGIIYNFLQELLSPTGNLSTRMQRIVNISELSLAILNIVCVSLYYFVYLGCPVLINVGYVCIVLTALLSLFLAIKPAYEYIVTAKD